MSSVGSLQGREENTPSFDRSNPYIAFAVAALAILAVSSVLLGLHYANSDALILKDIEQIPTSTLLEADVPVIALFGVLGIDRCVVAIRYEHWVQHPHPKGEEKEEIIQTKEKRTHFIVTTSDPYAGAPRGMCELTYQQLQVIAGNLVSPARFLIPKGQAIEEQNFLEKNGYIIEEVTLTRDGVDYQGFLVTHPDNSLGHYAIQAVGIMGCAQVSLKDMAEAYKAMKFNLLIVNPPGVAGSQGRTTAKTLGQAQETGIRFIETIGATKIILGGFSLGGGMIGQAILQHQFKQDKRYLALFQMTFGQVSHAAFDLIKSGTEHLASWMQWSPQVAYLGAWGSYLGIRLLDMEMDSVEAIKCLQKIKIPVVIVQKTESEKSGMEELATARFASDAIISREASLGFCVQQNGKFDDIFVYNPSVLGKEIVAHNIFPKAFVQEALQAATPSLGDFLKIL